MVVSEAGKRQPHPKVTAWLAGLPPSTVFVSAMTFGEVASGIARRRVGDPQFADHLERWSAAMREHYGDRTLPVTLAVAMRWGELCALLKRRDVDLLLAATALEHGLTVATRNVRHFQATGALLVNPYEI